MELSFEPKENQKASGKSEDVIINLSKLGSRVQKRYIPIHYTILVLNILAFIIIVLTGIVVEPTETKFFLVASIGLSMLIFLFPKIQEKKIIIYVVNVVIFGIYLFFIVYNFDRVVSVKDIFK